MSDMLNEQLGFAGGSDIPEADDMFTPQLDDIGDYMAHEEDDEDYGSARKRLRTETGAKKASASASNKKKKGSLPMRGELDPSLSAGTYAAVQASVDDIFGGLDGGDDFLDEDIGADEGDYETWAAAQEKKSAAKKKERVALKRDREALEEAAVAADPKLANEFGLIEKRKATAASLEENDVLEQLTALRARQMATVGGAATSSDGGAVAEEEGGAEMRSAYAKQLIASFRGLLGVRVKLQAVVARAAQFPQYYALPHFLKAADGPEASSLQAESTALLREILADCWAGVPASISKVNNHAAPASAAKRLALFSSPANSLDTVFQRLTALHNTTMSDANACITHWSAKVVTSANSAKTKAINQPLLDQIRAILSAKTRLLAKVQKNRSHARILGHPDHMKATSLKDRALQIAEGDLDEELFDDADFVRELAHRSGASAEKFEAALHSIQKENNKQAAAIGGEGSDSRIGFHRKTKGKVVNYDPRPKLVGFMVAKPYEMGEQHEAMLASLFQ